MTSQTFTVEQFTQAVAENIASKFELQPSKLLNDLVERLSGKLMDSLKTKQLSYPIQQNTAISSPSQNSSIFGKKLEDMFSVYIKKINQTATGIKSLDQISISKQNKSLLESTEQTPAFLFDGFTEKGLKDLQDKLPDILKKTFEKLPLEQSKLKKGSGEFGIDIGIAKGALGVLSTIGGLFAILYGLQTEGPYKGLAKIVGRGLIGAGDMLTKPLQEFIKMASGILIELPGKAIDFLIKTFLSTKDNLLKILNKIPGAEFFDKAVTSIKTYTIEALESSAAKLLSFPKMLLDGFKNAVTSTFDVAIKSSLGKIVQIPLNIVESFSKVISEIFGKLGGSSVVKIGLEKVGNFVPKLLGGILKTLKGAPLFGTLISTGFAVSRFMSGDIIGGGLDILSGIASLFPGVGTAISYAIDGLNAFLDYKAGGIGSEAKQTKGDIVGKWISELSSWMFEKLQNIPIIGPIIKAFNSFIVGDYLNGIKQLAYINPVFEAIGGLLGDSQAGTISTTIGNWGASLATDLGKWITDSLSELVNPQNIKDSIRKKLSESWNWIVGNNSSNPNLNQKTEYVDPNELGLAKGGVITQPTRALVGEAGAEAVIPLDRLFVEFNKQTNGLSKKTEEILEKIASNTGFTNQGLSNLIDGFNNLAKALKESGTISQAPIVVNQPNNQQQSKFAGVSQYAASITSPARGYNVGFAESMKPVRV